MMIIMMIIMMMMMMMMMMMVIQVMDCQNPDISVMDAKLFFHCMGEEGKQYELDLELLRDINTKVGVAASVAYLLQNMCPPGFGGLLCYPLELV